MPLNNNGPFGIGPPSYSIFDPQGWAGTNVPTIQAATQAIYDINRNYGWAPDITSTHRPPPRKGWSSHPRGDAIDVRTKDLTDEQIAQAAQAFRERGFHHLDYVGPDWKYGEHIHMNLGDVPEFKGMVTDFHKGASKTHPGAIDAAELGLLLGENAPLPQANPLRPSPASVAPYTGGGPTSGPVPQSANEQAAGLLTPNPQASLFSPQATPDEVIQTADQVAGIPPSPSSVFGPPQAPESTFARASTTQPTFGPQALPPTPASVSGPGSYGPAQSNPLMAGGPATVPTAQAKQGNQPFGPPQAPQSTFANFDPAAVEAAEELARIAATPIPRARPNAGPSSTTEASLTGRTGAVSTEPTFANISPSPSSVFGAGAEAPTYQGGLGTAGVSTLTGATGGMPDMLAFGLDLPTQANTNPRNWDNAITSNPLDAGGPGSLGGADFSPTFGAAGIPPSRPEMFGPAMDTIAGEGFAPTFGGSGMPAVAPSPSSIAGEGWSPTYGGGTPAPNPISPSPSSIGSPNDVGYVGGGPTGSPPSFEPISPATPNYAPVSTTAPTPISPATPEYGAVSTTPTYGEVTTTQPTPVAPATPDYAPVTTTQPTPVASTPTVTTVTGVDVSPTPTPTIEAPYTPAQGASELAALQMGASPTVATPTMLEMADFPITPAPAPATPAPAPAPAPIQPTPIPPPVQPQPQPVPPPAPPIQPIQPTPIPQVQPQPTVPTSEPQPTVAGLAPAIEEAIQSSGVVAPDGSRLGYSPVGGVTAIYEGAPEYVQVAATGPGLFGAIDRDTNTKIGSWMEDRLAGVAGGRVTGMGGAMLGRAVGSAFGPLGAMFGGLAGGFLGSQFGKHIPNMGITSIPGAPAQGAISEALSNPYAGDVSMQGTYVAGQPGSSLLGRGGASYGAGYGGGYGGFVDSNWGGSSADYGSPGTPHGPSKF